ncbi:DUF2255 family protein [Microbacterium sp.]|uniref:DUF2255 family protein n=1 Tax=Microbacterium sp. TaxID=51671 RepID=UPI0039C91A84
MVTIEGRLMVRAFQGADSRWFAAAVENRTGTIEVGGHLHHVTFQRTSEDDERISVHRHDGCEGRLNLRPTRRPQPGRAARGCRTLSRAVATDGELVLWKFRSHRASRTKALPRDRDARGEAHVLRRPQ